MPKFGTTAASLLTSKADENQFILAGHSVTSVDTVLLRRRLPKTTGRGLSEVTTPLSFAARRDKTFAAGTDVTKLGSVTISTVMHPGMDAITYLSWVGAEIDKLKVEVLKGATTGDITLDEA